MPRTLDLVGQKFSRWTVLSKHPERGDRGRVLWLCKCECGVKRLVAAASLRNGRSHSCGCYSSERKKSHGKSRTPIYLVWRGMLKRCELPSHDQYRNYGGRGISVCSRWRTFENFYADMGDRPKGMSLDRINNDGNYEPSNCRWASQTTQIRNKRNTAFIRYNGKRVALAAVCESLGVPLKRTRNRLAAGWPVKDALDPERQSRWRTGR